MSQSAFEIFRPSSALHELPKDIGCYLILLGLINASDVAKLRRLSKKTYAFFDPAFKECYVLPKLLQNVADGHIQNVERILNRYPDLLLRKINLIVAPGCTFEKITAFQYAVWAMDSEMWELILHKLDKIHAVLQLNELMNDRKDITDKYGFHFNFDPLITAYQVFMSASQGSAQRGISWKKVRAEFKKLPAWFIYAFTEPGSNAAWPTGDYTKKVNRDYGSLPLRLWHSTTSEHTNEGRLLGGNCSFVRGRNKFFFDPEFGRAVGRFGEGVAELRYDTWNDNVSHDLDVTKHLIEMQLEQLAKLQIISSRRYGD